MRQVGPLPGGEVVDRDDLVAARDSWSQRWDPRNPPPPSTTRRLTCDRSLRTRIRIAGAARDRAGSVRRRRPGCAFRLHGLEVEPAELVPLGEHHDGHGILASRVGVGDDAAPSPASRPVRRPARRSGGVPSAGRSVGSKTFTWAPLATSRRTISTAGELRRSSVPALKVRPQTARLAPASPPDPESAASTLATTRSNCSSLVCDRASEEGEVVAGHLADVDERSGVLREAAASPSRPGTEVLEPDAAVVAEPEDDVADVRTHRLAEPGDRVHEAQLGGEERVRGVFDGLGGRRIGDQQWGLCAREELADPRGDRLVVRTDHDPLGMEAVGHRGALSQELRIGDHRDVRGDRAPASTTRVEPTGTVDLLTMTDPGTRCGTDLLSHGFDEREVGRPVLALGGGYAEEDELGPGHRLGRADDEPEPSRRLTLVHQLLQAGPPRSAPGRVRAWRSWPRRRRHRSPGDRGGRASPRSAIPRTRRR